MFKQRVDGDAVDATMLAVVSGEPFQRSIHVRTGCNATA